MENIKDFEPNSFYLQQTVRSYFLDPKSLVLYFSLT